MENIKKKIKQMMSKNPYYTIDDLQQAWLKAMDIYKNIDQLNHDGNLFFNKLLKHGNHKLDNTLQWDLPSIITCKYACKHCYALKAERIYKNTRVMRLRNLILIELALKDELFSDNLLYYLRREIVYYNTKYGCNILRLHTSGDIYSKQYLDLVLEFCESIQNIYTNGIYHIYTYTKQLSDIEIDCINSWRHKHGLNIVKSMIPIDGKQYINYGSNEYIKDISKKLDKQGKQYYICDYGNGNHQSSCMGNCKACLYNDIVLFKQH